MRRGLIGACTMRLIAERSKESGNLVGIAPLGPEIRSAEGILVGHADRRVIDGCERVEPLFGAAARVVFGVFADIESDFWSGHSNFVRFVGELNRRRGDADD